MSDRMEAFSPASRAVEFGRSAAHLDVDFAAPRPQLVEALLAACELGPSPEEVAAWPLSRRVAELLQLTLRSSPAEVVWSAVCPVPSCSRAMDVPLDLRTFTRVPMEETTRCEVDATQLLLRMPTGLDLRSASESIRAGDALDAARLVLARRLVVAIDGAPVPADWELPRAWLGAIEQALAEADPLSAGDLDTQCPECGTRVTIAFDLEGQLLGLLERARERLYDEVHLLAAGYHWSEQDILAMPRERRAAYLARLTVEGWS